MRDRPISVMCVGRYVKFQHLETTDYWILSNKLNAPFEVESRSYSLLQARAVWVTLIHKGYELVEDGIQKVGTINGLNVYNDPSEPWFAPAGLNRGKFL